MSTCGKRKRLAIQRLRNKMKNVVWTLLQRGFQVLPILVLLAVSILEIGIFILVGQRIGLWPTLALIVITTVIGGAVIRITASILRGQIAQFVAGTDQPAREVLHDLLIFLSGLLLIIPGFATDMIGFAGLIPICREFLLRAAGRAFSERIASVARRHQDWVVIDGTASPVDHEKINRMPGPQ